MANLKGLYDMFNDKGELTASELVSGGFNSHVLTRLVRNGTLRKSGRGKYKLALADADIVYSLVDIFDRIHSGEVVVVLEPLKESDALCVVSAVHLMPGIGVVCSDELDGKKRVALRNIEFDSFSKDTISVMKMASNFYWAGLYQAAIDLYESVLPNMDFVDSYIYERLGKSYQNLIDVDSNNATKMIDYFTLAVISDCNSLCSRELNKLRHNYGYNGVRIRNDYVDENVKDGSLQYKI